MTYNSDIFCSKSLPLQPTSISIADGTIMPVTHIGTISSNDISLSDVYFVPQLSLNLLSVGQLCDLDLHLFFSRNGCLIQDPLTKTTVGTGHKIGRLFELTSFRLPPSRAFVAPTTSIWHSRLDHPSPIRLKSLISDGQLELSSLTLLSVCPVN